MVALNAPPGRRPGSILSVENKTYHAFGAMIPTTTRFAKPTVIIDECVHSCAMEVMIYMDCFCLFYQMFRDFFLPALANNGVRYS